MYEKLKKFLLSEWERKELFFDSLFDKPSKVDVNVLYDDQGFINDISSILMLKDNSPKKSKKNKKKEDEVTGHPINMNSEEELKFLDRLFSRIGNVMTDVQDTSIKLTNSFHKIRENYFRLSNLQRTELMKENPELVVQLMELEDSLVNKGVLLPSELNHLGSEKNYSEFGIEKVKKSSNEEFIKDLISTHEEDREKTKFKNNILFRNFMEKVGVDMTFTEQCFSMARNSHISKESHFKQQVNHLNEQAHNEMITEVTQKIREMVISEKVEKFMGLVSLLEFLEAHIGDKIDPKANYTVEEFGLMFGFEKNTRDLLETDSIIREMHEAWNKFELVDSNQSNIAR